jgi:hypothetical protein
MIVGNAHDLASGRAWRVERRYRLRWCRDAPALHGCWVIDEEGNVRGSGGELIPVVAGVVALLIALGGIFRGMTRITWDSVGQRFHDGDLITKQVAPGTPGGADVTLEAGPKVTWWKDVEIPDTQTSHVQRMDARQAPQPERAC